MNVPESIIEEGALEWFLLRQGFGGQVGELGYAMGHGAHLAPCELAAVRDSTGRLILFDLIASEVFFN